MVLFLVREEFLLPEKPKLYRKVWKTIEAENFLIRKMEKGEEDQVSAMIKKVFEKFVAPDYTSDGWTTFMQFINPATIYSRNFRGSSVTLLCQSGEHLVGVLELQNRKHILLLFVDGDYHRRGIAKRLLAHAVELCREAKTDTITVHASPYGEPIYSKLGFVPTSPQQEKDGIKFTPMNLIL